MTKRRKEDACLSVRRTDGSLGFATAKMTSMPPLDAVKIAMSTGGR